MSERGAWLPFKPATGVVVAIFIAALALAGCGGGDDGESGGSSDGSVRGAILPTATHLPAMVAMDEGMFADNGVEMDLQVVQNPATLPGAMGRQFEFGSSTIPDVIKARQQGIDITTISGLAHETSENPTVGLLAGPDTGITEAADLEGRTVGVITLGGNIHIATLDWLVSEGVDVDSINFVEVPPPNHADQLANGDIDASENLEPFRGLMLEAGANEITEPMLHVGDPVDIINWMAASDWAADNPETVENVVASLNQAIDFIAEDPDRAREILADYSGLPPEAAASIQLPGYGTDIPQELVATWAESLERIGELRGSAAEVADEEVLSLAPNAE